MTTRLRPHQLEEGVSDMYIQRNKAQLSETSETEMVSRGMSLTCKSVAKPVLPAALDFAYIASGI